MTGATTEGRPEIGRGGGRETDGVADMVCKGGRKSAMGAVQTGDGLVADGRMLAVIAALRVMDDGCGSGGTPHFPPKRRGKRPLAEWRRLCWRRKKVGEGVSSRVYGMSANIRWTSLALPPLLPDLPARRSRLRQLRISTMRLVLFRTRCACSGITQFPPEGWRGMLCGQVCGRKSHHWIKAANTS
jgi:hypothetical protein